MENLSKRIKSFDASGVRKFFEIAQTIKDPLDLSIGQPDFDVPEEIKNVATQSIKDGFNRYTATNGILELRKGITEKLRMKNGVMVDISQILVTSGTSGGIFLAYLTLLDPGDEVIILGPYFIMYKNLANLVGAKPRIVSTNSDFSPNLDSIEKAINEKTKMIVLNSPNNPTGAVYEKKDIERIVEMAKKKSIYILSDEVYEDFIYEGSHFSPGSIYDMVITLNGFSKSFSMTGWRIGYAAGPRDVINEMAKLQQFSYVCAPSFAQKAALKALSCDNAKIIQEYKQKRDIVYEGLKDNYKLLKPQGAFYVFIKTPYDEEKFVNDLLKRRIVVVPGIAFSQRRGYIRISYANDRKVLEESIKVFKELSPLNLMVSSHNDLLHTSQ